MRRTGSPLPITGPSAARRCASSELDDVPGLGPARRATLLKSFGSVRKLGAATVEEIAAVPGFGPRTAEAVHRALHGNSANGHTAAADAGSAGASAGAGGDDGGSA